MGCRGCAPVWGQSPTPPVPNQSEKSDMESENLISREEIMLGLPARRANTLLFLIQNQTAQLVAKSRIEFSLTDQTAQEAELAFLQAFTLGRRNDSAPTIQQLERYAHQWAFLVPQNPKLQAAVAHAMGQRYQFTRAKVPNIRATLCLDQKSVQAVYSRTYKQPLETLYAPQLSLLEQFNWLSAFIAQCLESLPPFWVALLITVALGLPQAFLALPIAVADVGPLVALSFLPVIGAINIVTMACMAEAIGRSSDFRYGSGFIKQLIANYLGDTGAFIFSLAIALRVFLIALACYIGLSITMADFTSIPAPIWAAVLFVTGLYLLLRRSLSFTVALMMLLAALNIGLLLTLVLFAIKHFQFSNLLYFNSLLLEKQFTQLSFLQRVLGVSLMLYFGHIYVGECAKLVLPRDSSASSLILGSIFGTLVLTGLFCLWILAMNGAIAPEVLSQQMGTVLEPLAAQIGPIVTVLGSVLIILLLGMAWIRSSSLLLNLGREWLVRRAYSAFQLPAHRSTLIVYPRGNPDQVPRIGITYLGCSGQQARFRLDVQCSGGLEQLEVTIDDRWDLQQLWNRFPDLRRWNSRLLLQVRSADADAVNVQIASSMVLTGEGELAIGMAQPQSEDLALPQNCAIEQWLIQLRLLWQHYRYSLISVSPLLLVFLMTEWLLFTGVQSFTNVLAFAGVLGNSLVGGVFPILLLISSRRKGELIPGVVLQVLNYRILQIGIYIAFVVLLLLHGLFIWHYPLARVSAIVIAVLCVAATLAMKQSGAFVSRVAVELRMNPQIEDQSLLRITAGGRPMIANVCLQTREGELSYQTAALEMPTLSSIQQVAIDLPITQERELRVWTHRNSANTKFNGYPVRLEVASHNQSKQFDLRLSEGQILLPLVSRICRLKIMFSE